MRTFSRYVAIGDSTTEGLDDPDGAGGYRGWADRLAEINKSWADPFPEAPPRLRTREQLASDVEWARRYFAPWLSRGIRRSRQAQDLPPSGRC